MEKRRWEFLQSIQVCGGTSGALRADRSRFCVFGGGGGLAPDGISDWTAVAGMGIGASRSGLAGLCAAFGPRGVGGGACTRVSPRAWTLLWIATSRSGFGGPFLGSNSDLWAGRMCSCCLVRQASASSRMRDPVDRLVPLSGDSWSRGGAISCDELGDLPPDSTASLAMAVVGDSEDPEEPEACLLSLSSSTSLMNELISGASYSWVSSLFVSISSSLTPCVVRLGKCMGNTGGAWAMTNNHYPIVWRQLEHLTIVL